MEERQADSVVMVSMPLRKSIILRAVRVTPPFTTVSPSIFTSTSVTPLECPMRMISWSGAGAAVSLTRAPGIRAAAPVPTATVMGYALCKAPTEMARQQISMLSAFTWFLSMSV